MASFPTFLIPTPTQGLQPNAIQRKPLDFSNLLQSLALTRKSKAAAQKSKTTPKEKDVTGRTGAVNQFYDNIAEIKKNISYYESEYGSGASSLPEYRQQISLLNQYTNPAIINSITRETEQLKEQSSLVNETNSQGNIDLQAYFSSNGNLIQTNEQALTKQELGPSINQANPLKYTDDASSIFQFDKDFSVSLYGPSDVEKELNIIFGSADNQYNSDLDKKTIRTLSTGIARGAGGNVQVLKKGEYSSESDLQTLTFAEQGAANRVLNGQLNLSDPLVSGLVQEFLRDYSGGRIPYTLQNSDGTTEKINLLNENGINVDPDNKEKGFYNAFQDYAKNKITSHLNKRYNQNVVDNLAVTKMNDGGSGKQTKSDDFIGRTQVYTPSQIPFKYDVKSGMTGMNPNSEVIKNINTLMSDLGYDIYSITKEKDDDLPSIFESFKDVKGNTMTMFSENQPPIKEMIEQLRTVKPNLKNWPGSLPVKDFDSEYLSDIYKSFLNQNKGSASRMAIETSTPRLNHEDFYNDYLPNVISRLEKAQRTIEEGLIQQTTQAQNAKSHLEGIMGVNTYEYVFTKALQSGSGIAIGDLASKQFAGVPVQSVTGSNADGSMLAGNIFSMGNRVKVKPGGEASNWRYNQDAIRKDENGNSLEDENGNVIKGAWNYYDINGQETVPSFIGLKSNGYLLNTFTKESAIQQDAFAAANWTSDNAPLFGTYKNFVGMTMEVKASNLSSLATMFNDMKFYGIDKDYGKEEVEETRKKIEKWSESAVYDKTAITRSNETNPDKRGQELLDKGYVLFEERKAKGGNFANKDVTEYVYKKFAKNKILSQEDYDKKYSKRERDSKPSYQEYLQFRSFVDNEIGVPEVNGVKQVNSGNLDRITSNFITYQYENNGVDVTKANLKRSAKVKNSSLDPMDASILTTMAEELKSKGTDKEKREYLKQYFPEEIVRDMNLKFIYNDAGVFESVRYDVDVSLDMNISKQLNSQAKKDDILTRAGLMKTDEPETEITEYQQSLLDLYKKKK